MVCHSLQQHLVSVAVDSECGYSFFLLSMQSSLVECCMMSEASFLTVLDISEVSTPQVPENIIGVWVCNCY